MVDAGSYNADPSRYQKLVDNLYLNHPGIMLPPEYAYFIEKDLLRFLIRLARYKFVAKMIRATDSVLEIGSGSGLGSIFMAQHCMRVTGIEVKSTEIEEAHAINRRANVEFIRGDFMDLPPTAVFNVVVALDVIEHMSVEQGRRFVDKISRHVAHDGMAIVGTPSIHSYQYQSELSRASHVKCYDQAELMTMMDAHFLRNICFCMNDELVHTGFSQLAWYYFVLAFLPRAATHHE
jgi:2-polyprenyl-3-methyl-5-hydroxy-6-metoxy-1,4-benzoquinol methylase